MLKCSRPYRFYSSYVCVSEKEFLDAIPEVIYAIESYDTTTVRASVGNWLISKYIKQNSEAKVIFNGGADKLWEDICIFILLEIV